MATKQETDVMARLAAAMQERDQARLKLEDVSGQRDELVKAVTRVFREWPRNTPYDPAVYRLFRVAGLVK